MLGLAHGPDTDISLSESTKFDNDSFPSSMTLPTLGGPFIRYSSTHLLFAPMIESVKFCGTNRSLRTILKTRFSYSNSFIAYLGCTPLDSS
jgi:hypothetical protein